MAAADALAGLHATEPATVHLAAWARVPGTTVGAVEDALYRRRDLVKQTAMRQTLFAWPRSLLPAVLGGPSARVADSIGRRVARDLESSGVTTDGGGWLGAAADEVVDALGTAELTAPELRAALPHLDVTIDRSPGTKWGASVPVLPQVLWVLTARGRVVRAGNAGHWRLSKPRYATAEAWFGEVPAPLDGRAAHAEIIGRWLRAFGPGTEDDLRWWLGGTLGTVRAALGDLGAVPVGLDGTDDVGWLLPDDLDPVDAPDPWAALLPTLDPTVMGWRGRGSYLGGHGPALVDTAGNAGTTAWWDGRVVGCWVQGEDARVRIGLLDRLPAAARRALDAEAERLTTWLDGVRVTTLYVSPAMREAAG
ncbi:winged helix DNA-binding domain-containing protein [Phycicoccus sonneratiae]|uniref:AlkZ family DNA glycosylase n=1 Tax=Phycicoccus sonneratiae TaxID=2807628 RepID=A0ABS2CI30_9MICO|nr:winged helix DNA-binding domain-containing protein [Phycicoccus sonneraticus]MBM6399522.1 AlkZ family DNA glycosylase [Phycicoccus sonneraticus]